MACIPRRVRSHGTPPGPCHDAIPHVRWCTQPWVPGPPGMTVPGPGEPMLLPLQAAAPHSLCQQTAAPAYCSRGPSASHGAAIFPAWPLPLLPMPTCPFQARTTGAGEAGVHMKVCWRTSLMIQQNKGPAGVQRPAPVTWEHIGTGRGKECFCWGHLRNFCNEPMVCRSPVWNQALGLSPDSSDN